MFNADILTLHFQHLSLLFFQQVYLREVILTATSNKLSRPISNSSTLSVSSDCQPKQELIFHKTFQVFQDFLSLLPEGDLHVIFLLNLIYLLSNKSLALYFVHRAISYPCKIDRTRSLIKLIQYQYLQCPFYLFRLIKNLLFGYYILKLLLSYHLM